MCHRSVLTTLPITMMHYVISDVLILLIYHVSIYLHNASLVFLGCVIEYIAYLQEGSKWRGPLVWDWLHY